MEKRARLVGFNHVAVEVDDVEEALDFYGRIQFIAISAERTQPPDTHRHVGIVVDDKKAVRRALGGMGVEILPGRGLDFIDPWGNRWQVVEYRDVQFTKSPEVLRGMGLDDLKKSPKALKELSEKGLAPDDAPNT